MRNRIYTVTLLKVLVAAVAITLLISVPALRIAPNLSYVGLAALILSALVGLLGVALAALYVAQFVLRHGGTDTQWLWFPGEPPGLQKLREEQKEVRRVDS